MVSAEIDIKIWLTQEGEGGDGSHWKNGPKVTHMPPSWECQSKQHVSLGRGPAEQRRSASAHCVKCNKGGMEVMMMVMRIKMMMALLCFPLTLLPWGILFSIIHSTVLRWPQSAATLQCPTDEPWNLQFTLCPALQRSGVYNNYVVFSLLSPACSQCQL